MTVSEILNLAIRVYGEHAQEDVAKEELAELITAISHKHRGRKHNIAEENADVEVVLEQLKIINNCHREVEAIKKGKIERLFNEISKKYL